MSATSQRLLKPQLRNQVFSRTAEPELFAVSRLPWEVLNFCAKSYKGLTAGPLEWRRRQRRRRAGHLPHLQFIARIQHVPAAIFEGADRGQDTDS